MLAAFVISAVCLAIWAAYEVGCSVGIRRGIKALQDAGFIHAAAAARSFTDPRRKKL